MQGDNSSLKKNKRYKALIVLGIIFALLFIFSQSVSAGLIETLNDPNFMGGFFYSGGSQNYGSSSAYGYSSSSIYGSNCYRSGETVCVDNLRRAVCGNYDSDSYLEWAPLKSCLGDTSCGYGSCRDSERPRWYCFDGGCRYDCVYDESCVKAAEFEKNKNCECSSGPCCDGCHYRSENWVCGSDSQSQYGCPWGTSCGSNVGVKTRIRLKYCSGKSAVCDGKTGPWLGWSQWKVADDCNSSESCSVGNAVCQKNSFCFSKFSGNNNGSGIVDSSKSEWQTSFSQNENRIDILLLVKKAKDEKWSKVVSSRFGDYIDFLIIITNNTEKNFPNVGLKIDLPKDVVYQNDLKVSEGFYKGDLVNGLFLDVLKSGEVKTISFKAVSSFLTVEDKEVIEKVILRANIGGLAISSNQVEVVFNSSKKQVAAISAWAKKFFSNWQNWIWLILGLLFVVFLIKKFSSWLK